MCNIIHKNILYDFLIQIKHIKYYLKCQVNLTEKKIFDMILLKLNKRKKEKMTRKTILFDDKTAEKIEQMAREAQRDFSKQVRFIIEEYIKLIEKK